VLTPEQESLLPVYRERWEKICLATGPTSRAEAVEAAKECYRQHKLPEPVLFAWFDSPIAGCMAAYLLENYSKLSNRAVAALGSEPMVFPPGPVCFDKDGPITLLQWSQVAVSLARQLTDQRPALAAARARCEPDTKARRWIDGLCPTDREISDDEIYLGLLTEFGYTLRALIQGAEGPEAISHIFSTYVSRCGYGQHDAGWLSFHNFMHEVLHTPECATLTGLFKMAQSGWWWPQDIAAILTDRPVELHCDAEGRLACTTGPALRYADGLAAYYVHGINVPAYVVEAPESITVDDIVKERNAEVRRVKLVMSGPAKFVSHMKLIQQDDFGKLYRYEVPDSDEPAIQVALVKNATPEPDGSYKDYAIPVPSTVRTAHEAIAQSFGLTVETYRPSVET
jgi:hypothetical protein